MIPIAVIDANDQLVEVSLDGWVGYIGVSWNEAGQFWTFSLRHLDAEYLVAGIPLSPMWPLLGQVRREHFPAGELVVDTYLDKLDRRSFADGLAGLLYLSPNVIADVIEITDRLRAPIQEGVSAAAPRTMGNAPLGYVGPPAPVAPASTILTSDDLEPLTDDNNRPLEL